MSETIEIDRSQLARLMAAERERFADQHPNSKALAERARRSLLSGVPMPFMIEWSTPFPIFAKEARGARLTDVDGIEYVDLCLGDSGAMFGHSPRATVDAVTEQMQRGLTFMLPTESAIWVGEELSRRFGLPYWQAAVTATDANRCVIRLARAITGRDKVLVYNGCYHGTVDEALATLCNGRVAPKASSIGSAPTLDITTRLIEFNDVDALEEALAHEDVACVLAEPALTNIGIILPEPGYHEKLRALTRRYGTLLVIDETHTICAGPGGCTKRDRLEPDILTLGKVIAGGLPAAVYGCSEEVARRFHDYMSSRSNDVDGIGGTLAGNALSFHAMRFTLEHVMNDAAYEHMISLATRWSEGVQSVIDRYRLLWHVSQLGGRAEYGFAPKPRNGGEAARGEDHELKGFVDLYCINRRILLAPFHNMALMSPATTDQDVDYHTEVFEGAVRSVLRK